MIDILAQAAITVCGITTVYLSQDTRTEYRRWACIVGCVAQPAWFYSAWTAGQWGVFLVCVFYALGWMRGVYNFWIRRAPA